MNAAPKLETASSDLTRRLWTQDLSREHGFEPLVVEGKLPAELRGTLYRNGPGQFGLHGARYTHPFEGDGAITAIRLDGKRALGASQVTQTAGLVEEKAAGRALYNSTAPWLRRMANIFKGRMKNTANTNVIMWQGRLFALMEAAKPTELDPQTLAMRGETDLDGAVVSMFSAHPHRVEARKAIYNFGLEYGRKTRLHLYELPDTGAAKHLGAIDLAGPPMLHDFIATETHLVFFISPVRVNLPRMFLQVGGFDRMWDWKPELGTEVICVPIDRPREPVRFTVDAFYQWHFTNAFTRNGELVIDYVRYPTFESFYEIGRAATVPMDRLLTGDSGAHRAVIDLAARTLRSEAILDRNCEFPTVAPGVEGTEHAFSYCVLDELRGIGKLDRNGRLTQHVLPSTQRITEPLFVRRGTRSEDDGWLVALCHDDPSNRAFFAVYDALRIPEGPLATAWFDHQVPITFHGTFAPSA
jgi:all-trans-8'-apo-beta-carotenal 15,15'-oxygenase